MQSIPLRAAARVASLRWILTVVTFAIVAAGCDDDPNSPVPPTSTPSATVTHTPLPTATATTVPSATPTDSPTPLPSNTPPTPPTATFSSTVTATSTATPTPEPSATPTPQDTPTPEDTPTPTIEPTATPTIDGSPASPIAGMAEGFADFPVGVPLGGYTGRCRCFGGSGRLDGRRTAYQVGFTSSVGVQTQPKIVALWLESGGEELVLLKTDAIYTFEGFVNELEKRLGAATGRDLHGRVVLASNHSHSAPANWDQGLTWYLGGDKFNREVFERGVASMERVALDAFERREPAAIGIGQMTDWDPNDRVYRDRRPENDTRVFFDDIPAGRYKDPYLSVLRVDTADGQPMGMFFAFAIHGTVAGEDNQLWSVEASGHVEAAVEERFGFPVPVGFFQHGAGDASPAGVDRLFARMESLGEFAADTIIDLWSRTPTSTAPLRIETVTRSIDTTRDNITVERDYGVLSYSPVDTTPGFMPDEIIFDEQDRVVTPIDEFNTSTGGAFCGSDAAPIPVAGVGSVSPPYRGCAQVGILADFIARIFNVRDPVVPLPESIRAKTTATRLGPVPILAPDGEEVTDDVLLAFFPGEPTSTYTEQFRRRVASEFGLTHTLPIGYSQDHEGYLLPPEDWLLGGYEPNINVWGPLQAEHIMEGVLHSVADNLLTEEIEPDDPQGIYGDTQYPEEPFPTTEPDLTPNAGTALAALPEYVLIPLPGLAAELAPPQQVRRVQDIVQFLWEGGDPAVDLPYVVLEREIDGVWEEVLTHAGRPVASPRHDILLATTPNPLFPPTAPQTHTWWLGWQAVSHAIDRAGLPTGTYRLHIHGHRYTGGATTWPWPNEPYDLTTPEFEVVPAEISLSLDGITLHGSIDAPAQGFRLVDVDGNSQGANPVRGATLTAVFADESRETLTVAEERISGGRTRWTLDEAAIAEAVAIEVVDADGNVGTLALD